MSFAIENGYTLEILHEFSAVKEEQRGIYSNLALNNLMPNDPSNVLYFKHKLPHFKLIHVPIDSERYFINDAGCLRYVIMKGTVEQHKTIEPSEIGEYLGNNIHELTGVSLVGGRKYVFYKSK